MKFHVENLGPIKKADFELGDFTVITGLNNTGKTYMAYAVYGFLKALPKYMKNNLEINTALASLSVDQRLEIDLEYFKQSFKSLLHDFSKQYDKNLNQIFSTNQS